MKIFRTSALIVVLVFVLLFAAVAWAFRSGWVESLLEDSLSGMAEAKVEIKGLDLDLFSLHASFEALIIGDKEHEFQNRLVTGRGAFEIDPMPLFEGKVVINEMSLEQVTSGTPRKTSGWIAKPAQATDPAPASADKKSGDKAPAEQSASGLDTIKKSLPKLDLSALSRKVDVDVLVKPEEMTSVQAVNKAVDEGNARFASIDKRFAEQTVEKDLAKIESDYNSIDFDKLKNPKDIQAAAEKLKGIAENSQKVAKDVKTITADTKADLNAVRAATTNIDDLVESDVKRVKSLANLGDLNTGDMAKTVFGGATMDTFGDMVGYAKIAGDIAASQRRPKYERGRGRDIVFPVTKPTLPGFLLKHAKFSGEKGKSKFVGTLDHLNSNPDRYAQPIKLAMSLDEAGVPWKVDGVFDHRGEKSLDQLTLTARGADMGTIGLGTSTDSGLPQTLIPKRTNIDTLIKIENGMLDGRIQFVAQRVEFAFDKAKAESATEQNIRAMFAGFDEVDLKAGLKGKLSDPQLSLSTNLDRKLSDQFQALLSAKIAATEKQIRDAVQAKARAKLDDAKKQLEAKASGYTEKLDKLASRNDKVQKELDKLKAQLEKKLKEQGTKQVEDKVKDKLKKLKL